MAKRLTMLLLGLGGGALLTVVTVGALAGTETPGPEPEQPPMASPAPLASTEVHEAFAVTLEPPPADASPSVSAEQADGVAWGERAPGTADSGQTLLASLTDENRHQGTLVWLVRYEGACVPNLGPDPAKSPCVGSEWNVLVDATTGVFIAAFSDQ
jgi:hypothetical protein